MGLVRNIAENPHFNPQPVERMKPAEKSAKPIVQGTIIGLPTWQITEWVMKELTNSLVLPGRKDEIIEQLVSASMQPDVQGSDIAGDVWNDAKSVPVRKWAKTIVENPSKARSYVASFIDYCGQRSLEYGTPFADERLVEATRRKPKNAKTAERKIKMIRPYSIFSRTQNK